MWSGVPWAVKHEQAWLGFHVRYFALVIDNVSDI